MNVIADLQIHSRFSRAVSRQMTLPFIHEWARRKGITLIATGDWNHPLWMRDIQEQLEETGTGFFQPNSKFPVPPTQQPTRTQSSGQSNAPLFLLATEVSCIYSQGGKGRRIHILIWVPSLKSALEINKQMTKRGCNLLSDGRPIIGLSAIELAEVVFTEEPKALVIPAHAWTPWFSLYGSMSGFESIEEAFGPYASRIYAIETGLSSSPDMNWRIGELDDRSILSFSDSHSGPKLGREATVFDIPDMSYQNLYDAIVRKNRQIMEKPGVPVRSRKIHKAPVSEDGGSRIAYTVEFFPEEGKYHWSGHRSCGIRLTPEDSRVRGMTCHVCGKPLTQGVVQRVEELAVRSEADLALTHGPLGISGTDPSLLATRSQAFPEKPPFIMMVPLLEILAESLSTSSSTKKVQQLYDRMISRFGDEFTVLLRTEPEDVVPVAGQAVAEGLERVRKRNIAIDPGYDGVFGKVRIWGGNDMQSGIDRANDQLSMF